MQDYDETMCKIYLVAREAKDYVRRVEFTDKCKGRDGQH